MQAKNLTPRRAVESCVAQPLAMRSLMEDIASSEDDLPDTEKPFDEGIRVAEVHALGVSKPQVWHGQARLGSAHEITHRTAGRCRMESGTQHVPFLGSVGSAHTNAARSWKLESDERAMLDVEFVSNMPL